MPSRVAPLLKFSPITLFERPLPFDDPDWVFEPEFDGFQGRLYVDDDVSKRRLVLRRFSR